MNRDHSYHQDHHDERARLAKLARHENDVRERERERERRRGWPLLNTSSRDSDDFEGCVE